MSTPKKHSILGLLLFIAVFGGINAWFIYQRQSSPTLQLETSRGSMQTYQLGEQKVSTTEIKKLVNANGFDLLLLKDGSVIASGSHSKGQLGVGPKEVISGQLYKVTFPANTFIADISATDSHTIALDANGGVWTWGLNISGQIGNNTHSNQNVPIKVLDDAAAVTAGYRFSAAAKKDGSLWAWGMSCDTNNPEFDKILQEFAASATAGGSYYGGVDSGDTQDCINEQNLPIASIVPRQIPDVSDVRELSGGYGHLIWMTSAGKLWTWGCNQYAQLGREKTFNSQNSRTPAPILTVQDKTFTAVSAGFRHTIALDDSGTLWAWGHNAAQEVTSETTDTVAEPRKVSMLQDIHAISAGYDSTAIHKNNAELYAAGDNANNRLFSSSDTILKSFTKIGDHVDTFTLGRNGVLFTRNNP